MFQSAQIIGLKREKFRVDIRKKRLDQEFQNRRSKAASRNCDQVISRVQQIQNELLSSTDSHQESLLYILIQILEEYEDQAYQLVCVLDLSILLTLQDRFPQYTSILICNMAMNAENIIDQFIANEAALTQFIQKHLDDQYVANTIFNYFQQALTCILYLIYSIPSFHRIVSHDNFKQLFAIAKQVNINFEVIIEIIKLCVDQLTVLPLEAIKPLLSLLDNWFYLDQNEVKQSILVILYSLAQEIQENERFAQLVLELKSFPLIKQIAKQTSILQFQAAQLVICIYGELPFMKNELDTFYTLYKKFSGLDKEHSKGRLQFYWALSNLVRSESVISDMIDHPRLIDDIMTVAIGETFYCQKELSYLFLNIVNVGSYQQCSLLISKGLLEILNVYMMGQLDSTLVENVGNTVIQLIWKSENEFDQSNDLHISPSELVEKLKSLQKLEYLLP